MFPEYKFKYLDTIHSLQLPYELGDEMGKFGCLSLRAEYDLTFATLTEVNDEGVKDGFEFKLCSPRVIREDRIVNLFKACLDFVFEGWRLLGSIIYSMKRYRMGSIDGSFNIHHHCREFRKGLCCDRRDNQRFKYVNGTLEPGIYDINRNKFYVKDREGSIIPYSNYDMNHSIEIPSFKELNGKHNPEQEYYFDMANYGKKLKIKRMEVFYRIVGDNIYYKSGVIELALRVNASIRDLDKISLFRDFMKYLFNMYIYKEGMTMYPSRDEDLTAEKHKMFEILYLRMGTLNLIIYNRDYNLYFVDGLLQANIIKDGSVIRYRDGKVDGLDDETLWHLEAHVNLVKSYNVLCQALPLFKFSIVGDHLVGQDVNMDLHIGGPMREACLQQHIKDLIVSHFV